MTGAVAADPERFRELPDGARQQRSRHLRKSPLSGLPKGFCRVEQYDGLRVKRARCCRSDFTGQDGG